MELAAAYDFVSQADIYRGRIGTENWHLLKYFFNSLSQAASVAPESYNPSNLSRRPSGSSRCFGLKAKDQCLTPSAAKSEPNATFPTRKQNTTLFPTSKPFCNNRKQAPLIDWFNFTPEEVDFLVKMNKY